MKSSENNIIGDFLRDEIKAAGKRQTDIARVMNISPATVNAWVRSGKISRDNLEELSKILKKDLIQALYSLSCKESDNEINYAKWVQILAYHVAKIQAEGMQLPPSVSSKWIAKCFEFYKSKPIPDSPLENQSLKLEVKKLLKSL